MDDHIQPTYNDLFELFKGFYALFPNLTYRNKVAAARSMYERRMCLVNPELEPLLDAFGPTYRTPLNKQSDQSEQHSDEQPNDAVDAFIHTWRGRFGQPIDEDDTHGPTLCR